jgi:WD40 repeat protein
LTANDEARWHNQQCWRNRLLRWCLKFCLGIWPTSRLRSWLVLGLILGGIGQSFYRPSLADEPFPSAVPWMEFTMSSILPADSQPVAKRVYRLRFSPNHEKLAIRDGSNNVWQYDLKQHTAQLAARTPNDLKRLQDFAYSSDGQYLYGIGERGNATWQCWTTKDLELASSSQSVEGRHIERTLGGELMVNGRDVMNLSSPTAEPKVRKRSGLVRSHEGSVTLIMYNLSGLFGESGLEWKEQSGDATSDLQTPVLNQHWQGILQRQVGRAVGRQSSVGGSLLLSPCGNRVVLLDRRELLLWDAATNEPWQLLSPDLPGPQHLPISADILSAKFSPNGQWLVIGTVGRGNPEQIPGEVHLIDMVAGCWLGRITTTTQSASAIDFSDDQRWLAVGSTSLLDDRIRIFDVAAWLETPTQPDDHERPQFSKLDDLAMANPRSAMLQVFQLRQQAAGYREELTSLLTYDPSHAQQMMAEVIEKMDSPTYSVRDRAESELQRMAELFPTTIRELMDLETLSSESRFRIKRTIAAMTGIARMSVLEWQVLCRSLHALEGVGEPWAGQLLADTCQHPIRFVARAARLSHQVWLSRYRGLGGG